jgi:hypothetical protein
LGGLDGTELVPTRQRKALSEDRAFIRLRRINIKKQLNQAAKMPDFSQPG